jgi:stearoyl-CoA desaturase (delta-9 desaturase)
MTTSASNHPLRAALAGESPAVREENLDLPAGLPLGTRVANLIVILVPFAGLIAAMVYAWGWGLGWTELGILFAMYAVTGFGVTIGYHRLFTHRSFEAGPVLTTLLGVAGSMSIEGSILRWVAFHRAHHQHSDQHDDPHSPHNHEGGFRNALRGAWHAHAGWMFEPVDPDLERYVPDLKKDRLVRTISRLFPLWAALGLILPAVAGGLITMSWTGAFLGFLWGGLVRVLLVHHATWSVNSICHIWGTRPYRSHDESRNNVIVGVLALGEGWHNNHHAFPTSARHGLHWWQIDLSWILIWGMKKLGLIRKVRVPTPDRLEAKRTTRGEASPVSANPAA